jgi:hypothetical protein
MTIRKEPIKRYNEAINMPDPDQAGINEGNFYDSLFKKREMSRKQIIFVGPPHEKREHGIAITGKPSSGPMKG